MYSRKEDFLLMIGNFDVKSCNWSIIYNKTPKESQLDSITSLYPTKQHISEQIDILEYSSSGLNLIFTDQLNIVMYSSVHSSLDSKYHYQIIYSKLNVNIANLPLYICKTWNCNRVEFDSINRAVENCDCPSLLLGKRYTNK